MGNFLGPSTHHPLRHPVTTTRAAVAAANTAAVAEVAATIRSPRPVLHTTSIQEHPNRHQGKRKRTERNERPKRDRLPKKKRLVLS